MYLRGFRSVDSKITTLFNKEVLESPYGRKRVCCWKCIHVSRNNSARRIKHLANKKTKLEHVPRNNSIFRPKHHLEDGKIKLDSLPDSNLRRYFLSNFFRAVSIVREIRRLNIVAQLRKYLGDTHVEICIVRCKIINFNILGKTRYVRYY